MELATDRKRNEETAPTPAVKAASIEMGRYGPIKPRTPANGFTIIANVKPGHAERIRKTQAELVNYDLDEVLKPLKLHFLKWILFDNDTRFMYLGIFDTDFDKYTEDAVMLFNSLGRESIFVHLEGFPEDGMTNVDAFAKFVRAHHVDSFLEYARYPNVTAEEILKALKIKKSFSSMLDEMQ
jgi:hypothetical protein